MFARTKHGTARWPVQAKVAEKPTHLGMGDLTIVKLMLANRFLRSIKVFRIFGT